MANLGMNLVQNINADALLENAFNTEDENAHYALNQLMTNCLLKGSDILKRVVNHPKFRLKGSIFSHQIQIDCVLGNKDDVAKYASNLKKNLPLFNTKPYSPLLIACSLGHTEIVKLITELKGVNLDHPFGMHMETPFSLACSTNRIEIVRLLLKLKEIDPNGDRPGKTLFDSCWDGNLEIAEMLIQDERVEKGFNYRGVNPLNFFCRVNSERSLNVVKLFLKYPDSRNFNLNTVDEYNLCPLANACISQKTEVVKLLLKFKELDINKGLKERRSAFDQACYHSRIEIARILLEDPRIKINFIHPGCPEIRDMVLKEIARRPERIGIISAIVTDLPPGYSKYSDMIYNIMKPGSNGKRGKVPHETFWGMIEIMRLDLGVVEEMAAGLWCFFSLIDGGFLSIREPRVLDHKPRWDFQRLQTFTNVTFALPMELRMKVTNRVYRNNSDFIKQSEIELAKKEIMAELLK